jgi:hypothetical protein
MAGLRWGTATSSSTNYGTTSRPCALSPYARYANHRLIEPQIGPSPGKLAIGRLEVELAIDAGGHRDPAGGSSDSR